MTGSSQAVRRRRTPGVDFRSSGGLYRNLRTGNPRAAAAPGSRMGSEPEDTIEARIARWLETGEGEAALMVDLQALIESWRRRYQLDHGPAVGGTAIDEALGLVWERIKGGFYDPKLRFTAWLKVVLDNKCTDSHRKTGRGPILFAKLGRPNRDQTDPQVADETDEFDSVILTEFVDQAAQDIERFLDPSERLIFSVASGIADLLDRPLIDRWIAACHPGDTPTAISRRSELRSAIDNVLDSQFHGRQTKLAAAFGLRPDACRQRYTRIAHRLAEQTNVAGLRRLILGADASPE